jgi:hypothetical protein
VSELTFEITNFQPVNHRFDFAVAVKENGIGHSSLLWAKKIRPWAGLAHGRSFMSAKPFY